MTPWVLGTQVLMFAAVLLTAVALQMNRGSCSNAHGLASHPGPGTAVLPGSWVVL